MIGKQRRDDGFLDKQTAGIVRNSRNADDIKAEKGCVAFWRMYCQRMEQEPDNEWGEIEAMKSVGTAIAKLDKEAQSRVLRWAVDKFDFAVPSGGLGAQGRPAQGRGDTTGAAVAQPGAEQQFADLADLFGAAAPSTESEKALVVGYWFQVTQGQPDLDSQTVNAELKNLGHGVLNITRALESLIATRPQLVIQTRKSGSSKQARKKYRLTGEGIARVRQMISRPSTAADHNGGAAHE